MWGIRSERSCAGSRLRVAMSSLLLCAGVGVVVSVPATTATASANPSTLTWGVYSVPNLFGPTCYSTECELVMTLVQGQMILYGPQGQLEPGILSSWKTVSPLEYQYTVRSGARFSDGNPVTAADIAYDFNLQFNKKLASAESGLVTNVKSVTYSGDVVTIKLKQPDALVRQLPASIIGLVYEKSSVEKHLLNYGTPQVVPVGAGPYMVQSWVPDDQMVLVPNPYWYGGKPHFSKITLKMINDPDLAARLRRQEK